MPEDIFWTRYANRFRTFSPLNSGPINENIDIAVCIPVFAEPNLLKTLDSLYSGNYGDVNVEVLLLFNNNDFMTAEESNIHDHSVTATEIWIREHDHPNMKWIPLVIDKMPEPKGGVGWARKLCMDEAARRLGPEGIIVCLDADCTVAGNYILEIKKQFRLRPDQDAATIYFEHQYEELDDEDRRAIVEYELHLRYLVYAQRWCGHLHAYQTVGSSMAVRRNAYLAQGGMNTRRAGEDFYFLHKFTATENVFDIFTTTVFPSARISTRVPFGTGKAMQQTKISGDQWLTTSFQSFREIKILFDSIEDLWINRKSKDKFVQKYISHLSEGLTAFLHHIDFEINVYEIAKHTSTLSSFRKRFFRYFNAFQMIKYMHFMRVRCHADIHVSSAVKELIAETGHSAGQNHTAEDLLKLLRNLEKQVTT